MASVLGNKTAAGKELTRVGRCLRGWVDGKSVFRFIEEEPRRQKLHRRPHRFWFLDGWFTHNLLDE